MILELAPRIVVDPDIRFGKPIIKGTRVPVNLVVAKVSGGMTFTDIADEYDLTREDIQAALAYAAQVVADEEIRLVGMSWRFLVEDLNGTLVIVELGRVRIRRSSANS